MREPLPIVTLPASILGTLVGLPLIFSRYPELPLSFKNFNLFEIAAALGALAILISPLLGQLYFCISDILGLYVLPARPKPHIEAIRELIRQDKKYYCINKDGGCREINKNGLDVIRNREGAIKIRTEGLLFSVLSLLIYLFSKSLFGLTYEINGYVILMISISIILFKWGLDIAEEKLMGSKIYQKKVNS